MIWARAAFVISVFLLFYVYVGYPLLLMVVAAFRPKRQAAPDFTPFISVLIAACNEEANIQQKLEQTLQLDYPSDHLEVLVLSDGSSDRTDEIVRQFPHPGVRLVRIAERKGKTNAQNQGVKVARGEILVFSDATTIYHPQALRLLAANYKDPTVGAVSGRYKYFDPKETSPTGAGTVAFWNYENNIKMQQSRISSLTGCCGCIYSLRKSCYTELAPDIISDLVQPLWVVQKGLRVVFEDRALAYEETTESIAEEFSMRVRVITRGMRGLLSVPGLLRPWRYGWISFQLLSHKMMRWMVPLFLVLALVSNAFLLDSRAYQIFFGLQLAFYLLAALQVIVPMHRSLRLLGIPLYFCTLNLAALVSMVQVLRGNSYTVWQPMRKRAAE